MDGIIIVDKPDEFTSFDVVAVMRGLCKQKKVGHTGTLDPMATGVLPILLGKATKCAPFLEDTNKEYEVNFVFGTATDTEDCTGKITQTSDRKITQAELEAVLPKFTGPIFQVPPMYSAVQVNGERLYKLARQGIEIERDKRPVTIYKCELRRFSEETQAGVLVVNCSKGTYIRTLCADMGKALGSYGMMTALRRTVACGYTLQDAIPLEEARALVKNGDNLTGLVRSIDRVFLNKPKVQISAPQTVRFKNGGGLDIHRLGFTEEQKKEDGQEYRVYSDTNVFLGLGVLSLSKSELSILRLF